MNYPSSYVIKEFSVFDWKMLTILFKQCFPPLTLKNISFTIRHHKDTIRLCIHEQKIVGFLVYYPTSMHSVWLDYLAVKNDMLNMGIGSLLIEHMENELSRNGFSVIELVVFPENHSAVKFYKKHGYRYSQKTGKKLKFSKSISPSVPPKRHSDNHLPAFIGKKLKTAFWYLIYQATIRPFIKGYFTL